MENKKNYPVDNYLNPVRWEQMEKLAQSLVQSKAFPKSIQNAAQALVVMQAGVENGTQANGGNQRPQHHQQCSQPMGKRPQSSFSGITAGK